LDKRIEALHFSPEARYELAQAGRPRFDVWKDVSAVGAARVYRIAPTMKCFLKPEEEQAFTGTRKVR